MERHACTRSFTRAASVRSVVEAAGLAVLPAEKVNPAFITCDRLILTRKKLVASQPVRQFVEPPSTKRPARPRKIKRTALAVINNDQQQLLIKQPPADETLKARLASVDVITQKAHSVYYNTPPKTKQSKQLLITNFIKVRRSTRQTAAICKEKRDKEIVIKLHGNVEDGLVKKWFDVKGYGVVAGRPFKKDEFVCEYAGDLLGLPELACKRECQYALTPNVGCYMYYFKYRNRTWCVDATVDNGRFGRLLNHSRREPNVKTQVMEISNQPRLYFVALRDIVEGEELVYDYGERRAEVLEKFPWLKDS